MKKILTVLTLALMLSLMLTSTALADNGPHGGFTTITNACASCHRTHTATGPKLLTGSGYLICLSCHGAGGALTGANTDVIDGVYAARAGLAGQGTVGRGLLAGGFAFALIDSNLDGTVASAATSSAHIYNGNNGTVWAYGAISAVANNGQAATSLSCMNCHDPHGKAGTGKTATYRILRPIPTGLLTAGFPAAGVDVPDEAVGLKTYTIASATGNYFTQTYVAARQTAMTNWCSQCHTRDLTATGSGSTNSGDAVFMYRHTTNTAAGANVLAPNGMACTSCHVAHGTTASVTAPAAGAGLVGGSALLRVDERGVCQSCHQK